MTTRLNVPLAKPKPDCRRFIRAVTTDYQPPKPPLIEYILDRAVLEPALGLIGRKWVDAGGDRAQQAAYWDNFIAFWHRMGYDIVRLEIGLHFPRSDRPGGIRGRHFAETGVGPIAARTDLDNYPWPKVGEFDFWPLEYVATHLPEGMGLITNHAGGPYEIFSFLLGYEGLCLKLFDQPDLVADVARRVGQLMEEYYRHLLTLPNVVAVFPGDDMGFRSGTLISPADLRQHILPWHRRFAAMAHARGLPYFLHSCGNILELMDDLIDDVGIQAKHSFEDAVMPMAEFKRRYGKRIGVLGGVDLNVLTRSTPEELRRYVRRLIDDCAGGGRFAIGSGNSIPDYIPPENYLTMIDEALR
jgi:uroporphyrinogen decarboxylase